MSTLRNAPLCLAGLAVACALMAPASGRPSEPPKASPALPVVKTWGELRKEQATTLARGVSVRLGIQAAECGVAEGVFVYCLTEGYAPPKSWSEDDMLGPVYLALTDGDGNQLDRTRHGGFGIIPSRKVPAGLDKCELLFLRRVVMVRPGVGRVRVEQRVTEVERRVLAVSELKGAKVGHAWLRFEYTGPERVAGQTAFAVRNAAVGPALPSWPELCPLVSRGTVGGTEVHRPADEPLPRLIPDDPKLGVEVAVSDGVLTVRSKAGIGTHGPDHHFLARWWVNGKPATVAVPKEPDFGSIGGAFTDDAPFAQVKLRLDLAMDRLGAKRGDEVGLQLLYCEHGFEPVTERKTKIIKGWDRDILPLLSNRVAFKVK